MSWAALLALGRSQHQAQCDINLSPSPLLKHYRLVCRLCAQGGAPGGAGGGVDGMVALCWSGGSPDRVWHVRGDQSLAVLVADRVSAASGRGQPFLMPFLQEMTRSVF